MPTQTIVAYTFKSMEDIVYVELKRRLVSSIIAVSNTNWGKKLV